MQQPAHPGDGDNNRKFRVYETSLGYLLNLDHYRLVIPAYQRPYEWRGREVQVLLNDLKNSQDAPISADKYLLLGSVLLFQHSKGDPLQVVDGQQRLSTIMLIYSVLCRRLCELDGVSAELEVLSKRFICNDQRILVLNNTLAGDDAESADSIVETWENLTDFADSVLSATHIASKNDKYTMRWKDIEDFVTKNFTTSKAVQQFIEHLNTHVYVSVTLIWHLGLALQCFVRCNSTGEDLG